MPLGPAQPPLGRAGTKRAPQPGSRLLQELPLAEQGVDLPWTSLKPTASRFESPVGLEQERDEEPSERRLPSSPATPSGLVFKGTS